VEPRIHFITLGVADLDAARDFYAGGLGWTPLVDVPGEVIFFQVGPGLVLGLYTGLEGDVGDGVALADPGRAPLSLSHNVESEEAVRSGMARAAAAGAAVLKPPQRADFGGYHGYFADPAGFRWEICHNPGWSVDADGTVRMGGA
jgi:catechol 2,3-dioxygenase-like lactoylglutathione lyase family enzyme